ncbi:MAG: cytidylyltransferase domain-containing protein [Thermodesulfobacteriota bacterium]
MSEKLRVLGVIPARGGSKGVPRKNIKLLCGKPLIAYTIVEALKSKYLTKVVTSTDDEEIARIAREWGSDVIMRPKDLGTDDSPVIETIKHAILFTQEREKVVYDYIALLQPTSPLRIVEDLDAAIEKMICEGGDSATAVTEINDSRHPARMKRVENNRIVDIYDPDLDFAPRQRLPKIYIRNGAIYIVKREIVFEKNSLRGDACIAHIMPEERSVNIDSITDFMLAELMIGKSDRVGQVK